MAKEDSFMSPSNSYPGHDSGTDAPGRVDGIPFHSPSTMVPEAGNDSSPHSINSKTPDGVKGK